MEARCVCLPLINTYGGFEPHAVLFHGSSSSALPVIRYRTVWMTRTLFAGEGRRSITQESGVESALSGKVI